jgi:hypothetical protein
MCRRKFSRLLILPYLPQKKLSIWRRHLHNNKATFKPGTVTQVKSQVILKTEYEMEASSEFHARAAFISEKIAPNTWQTKTLIHLKHESEDKIHNPHVDRTHAIQSFCEYHCFHLSIGYEVLLNTALKRLKVKTFLCNHGVITFTFH